MEIERRPGISGGHEVGQDEEQPFAQAAREIYQPNRGLLLAQNEAPPSSAKRGAAIADGVNEPVAAAELPANEAARSEKPLKYRPLKGGRRAENDEERKFENKLQSGELFAHYTKITAQLADDNTKVGATRALIAAGPEAAPAVYQALRSSNQKIADGAHEVLSKIVAQGDPHEVFDTPELANFWRVQQLDGQRSSERAAVQRELIEIGTDTVPALLYGARLQNFSISSGCKTALRELAENASVRDLSNAPELVDHMKLPFAERLQELNTRYHELNRGTTAGEQQPTEAEQKAAEEAAKEATRVNSIEFRTLIRQIDFLQQNPGVATAKAEQLLARNKQLSEDPSTARFERESELNTTTSSELKSIDRLAADVRIKFLDQNNNLDLDERRNLVIEAMNLFPSVIDSPPCIATMRNAKLFQDRQFAEIFEQAGGDLANTRGDHVTRDEVRKSMELRLQRVRSYKGQDKDEVLGNTLDAVATRYEEYKDFGKAAACLRERIELQPESMVSAVDLWRLSKLYSSASDKDGMEFALENILKLSKKSPGSVTKDIVPKAYDELIKLAGSDAKRLVQLSKDSIGLFDPAKDQVQISNRHRQIAQSLEQMNDAKGAETHLLEAIKIKRADNNRDQPWLADDFMAMGDFLKRRGRQEEAVPYYEKILDFSEHSRFSTDFDVAAKALIDCLKTIDPTMERAKAVAARVENRNGGFKSKP
jgi:tetratricopeptide (TPR) repeat protein